MRNLRDTNLCSASQSRSEYELARFDFVKLLNQIDAKKKFELETCVILFLSDVNEHFKVRLLRNIDNLDKREGNI